MYIYTGHTGRPGYRTTFDPRFSPAVPWAAAACTRVGGHTCWQNEKGSGRGNHLSNAACLTHAFFKSDE